MTGPSVHRSRPPCGRRSRPVPLHPFSREEEFAKLRQRGSASEGAGSGGEAGPGADAGRRRTGELGDDQGLPAGLQQAAVEVVRGLGPLKILQGRRSCGPAARRSARCRRAQPLEEDQQPHHISPSLRLPPRGLSRFMKLRRRTRAEPPPASERGLRRPARPVPGARPPPPAARAWWGLVRNTNVGAELGVAGQAGADRDRRAEPTDRRQLGRSMSRARQKGSAPPPARHPV